MLLIYDRIGIAGVAIVVLSVAGLYYFIKTALFLSWTWRDFQTWFVAVERGKVDLRRLQSDEPGNPLGFIMVSIARAPASRRKDLDSEVTWLFHRAFGSTNLALTVLRLISVLSPLLGLMGTVLGISRVFRSMATHAVVDSTLLAGGIWEALITTIMGLGVAIPTLVFYYILRLRVRALMLESIEYGHRVAELAGGGADNGS
ncbi:MAG: MotA/TolQ/ExbB proton channel family protein [Kiritimatiellae bacterium]|nr:MotA/TolQ/ExbB proton channel family protein [Kiritimatiellia bacterium]